jgi:sulfoacetaldehyde acetyltransferase
MSSSEGSPIAPRRALRELARALPRNSIVTTDIGNVCSIANSYLEFEEAPSFFAAMSFGNCGYAFPTAMGAKVARPDRPAVAYVGDGAWGMSLNEVLTCVREGIPAIAVVFNNGQWGAEKKNQIDYYADRFLGTNLVNPSFAGIARAMGADGITVDHPDQIGDALRAAIASGRPTVLELMLTQELGDPFRRDALKKPRRLLAKYAAYSVA